MNATAVLDAIAHKYSSCAMVREVVVEDSERRAAQRAFYKAQNPRFVEKYWPGTEDFTEDHGRILDTHKPFRRIDALMFDGGGTRTAIEVKISRADYLRETDAKRRPWRKITHRFIYATPAGLLKPEEIPDGCGLWEVTDRGVRIVKRAKSNKKPDPIPHQVIVAFAYRIQRAAAAERNT